ncbi:MAG: hypothetical protein IT307_14445 [Chloroflexi bacterium]|nr:hypothetical protein [Chloroflexota bacterium]
MSPPSASATRSTTRCSLWTTTARPSGGLAERWDAGSDGKTFTHHLRKEVMGRDGVPFTAQDAKSSLLEVGGKYNGTGSGARAPLERLGTPDDYTLIRRLKEPCARFSPNNLTDATHVQIVATRMYEGSDPTRNDAKVNQVGTGSFKLVEWVKSDHTTLERDPSCWNQGQELVLASSQRERLATQRDRPPGRVEVQPDLRAERRSAISVRWWVELQVHLQQPAGPDPGVNGPL